MKLNSLVFLLISINVLFSCSKDDESSNANQNSVNKNLPSTIILKDIPTGTFIMGGDTRDNDAPKISVTMSAFKISEKEITNKEYVEFLNSAYLDSWIEVVEEQIMDPCGKYSEYVIKGLGNAPNAGKIYLQLGETGGCTSSGEKEHIDNKSWISFNFSNKKFELIDSGKGNFPVNWVKWYGAYSFAKYYGVSLPSEAQWEYAGRGGQQLEYPTNDGTLSFSKANYNGDIPAVYNPNGHSVEVGSYPSNPYGLHDMGGNVWEWCLDYYAKDFYNDNSKDPVNVTTNSDNKRVRRGGSWNYHSSTLLTYSRASDFENRGNNHFGFRIVKSN